MFALLQENNVLSNQTDDCEYLRNSVIAWLLTVTYGEKGFNPDIDNKLSLQFAQVLPIRCEWQKPDGIITICKSSVFSDEFDACGIWNSTIPSNPLDATPEHFANALGTRPGELLQFEHRQLAQASFPNVGIDGVEEFYVKAIFNESRTVAVV
jgi:hypothetical protein